MLLSTVVKKIIQTLSANKITVLQLHNSKIIKIINKNYFVTKYIIYKADKPTRVYTTLINDGTKLNINFTKSKLKIPISPQLIPPIITSTNVSQSKNVFFIFII